MDKGSKEKGFQSIARSV